MSADQTKPDDAASIADLPAKTPNEDADASKVKGGGIVPEVSAGSLLSQPAGDGLSGRAIGRAIGYRG